MALCFLTYCYGGNIDAGHEWENNEHLQAPQPPLPPEGMSTASLTWPPLQSQLPPPLPGAGHGGFWRWACWLCWSAPFWGDMP